MTAAEKTRLLAERVMGWGGIYQFETGSIVADRPNGSHGPVVVRLGEPDYPGESWNPLTNLSHAGEVLEAMVRKGFEFDAQDCGVGKYKAWFRGEGVGAQAYARTLATAICHAALLANGVREEEL